MTYPDEIIVTITEQFGLLELHQRQLRETLMAEGIQTAIDADFDPANLIILLETPAYISVLSPAAAQQIVANPMLLEELRELAAANSEAWTAWNEIKSEIQEIHNLPPRQNKFKVTLTRELYPKLISFSNGELAEFLRTHFIMKEELRIISQSLAQYLNILAEPIQESATIYFTALFERMGRTISEIRFTPKRSGVQLGTTMAIEYTDDDKPQIITYYIKTHQHGSTSQVSSVKPIDLKEIFIYKVLEYIGYGPKTHFFFNPLSSGGFFIATQDAAFTKVSGKEKVFEMFDEIVDNYERTHASTDHNVARRNIIALDILSRILRISDTTTNPGNYGRVTVNGERTKWKLLDFRVQSEPDITYLRREIFEDFRIGNGVFNYDAREFFRGVFRVSATERRKFSMAHEIIKEFREGKPCQSRENKKMPLSDAIKRAFDEIRDYVTGHGDSLRLDRNAALNDLARYFEAIKQNFGILAKGIEVKHAELSEVVEESKSFRLSSPTM
jgi:hypothetical protein